MHDVHNKAIPIYGSLPLFGLVALHSAYKAAYALLAVGVSIFQPTYSLNPKERLQSLKAKIISRLKKMKLRIKRI